MAKIQRPREADQFWKMGHKEMAKRIRTISAAVTGLNFTRCGENLKPLLWVYALTFYRVYETYTCKKKKFAS